MAKNIVLYSSVLYYLWHKPSGGKNVRVALALTRGVSGESLNKGGDVHTWTAEAKIRQSARSSRTHNSYQILSILALPAKISICSTRILPKIQRSLFPGIHRQDGERGGGDDGSLAEVDAPLLFV